MSRLNESMRAFLSMRRRSVDQSKLSRSTFSMFLAIKPGTSSISWNLIRTYLRLKMSVNGTLAVRNEVASTYRIGSAPTITLPKLQHRTMPGRPRYVSLAPWNVNVVISLQITNTPAQLFFSAMSLATLITDLGHNRKSLASAKSPAGPHYRTHE